PGQSGQARNVAPGFRQRVSLPTVASTPSQRADDAGGAAIAGCEGSGGVGAGAFGGVTATICCSFSALSRAIANAPDGVSPNCLMKFSNNDWSVVFFIQTHVRSASLICGAAGGGTTTGF